MMLEGKMPIQMMPSDTEASGEKIVYMPIEGENKENNSAL